MATKIVKVVETIAPGSTGGDIQHKIAMAIATAQRQVRREKGLVIPIHHRTMVKILIEQEFEDGH